MSQATVTAFGAALDTITDPGRLRLAIPNKGRMLEPTIALLRDSGLDFEDGSRALVTRVSTFPLDILSVRTDDIAAKFGPGPEGVAKLVKKVAPRFLLLAGDSETVPTFVLKGDYVSDRFSSDPDLATELIGHVGAPGSHPARAIAAVRATGAIAECRRIAADHAGQAIAALTGVARGEPAQALITVAEAIVVREV